ncbi:hypothetical protein BDV95DRAFT_612612 [Massariosphaeria phaeospora]|uniref:BTB domain-containing protein n=1 Tax=Massariosphaeria phaeospora TaxID=100035 RepID=A0A7C8HYU1_9PLEO|nr:hypothetical protein BDV95DRAFT_612612 [Massariosphaeria phaeospora]
MAPSRSRKWIPHKYFEQGDIPTNFIIRTADNEEACIFHVHRNILKKSRFFNTSLDYKEGQESLLTLHNEVPDYVALWLDFLYFDALWPHDIDSVAAYLFGTHIPQWNTWNAPATRHTYFSACLRVYLDLWELADRYCEDALRDAVVRGYAETLADPFCHCHPGVWFAGVAYYYEEGFQRGLARDYAGSYLVGKTLGHRGLLRSSEFDEAVVDYPRFAEALWGVLRERPAGKVHVPQEWDTPQLRILYLKERSVGPFR